MITRTYEDNPLFLKALQDSCWNGYVQYFMTCDRSLLSFEEQLLMLCTTFCPAHTSINRLNDDRFTHDALREEIYANELSNHLKIVHDFIRSNYVLALTSPFVYARVVATNYKSSI